MPILSRLTPLLRWTHLGALALGLLGTSGVQAKSVTVGMLFPLTGPSAPIGMEMRDGALLCLDEAKSLLGDTVLSAQVFDDASNTDTTKKVLTTLSNDPKTLMVLLGSVSGVSVAAAESLRARPMAMVGALTVANAFTGPKYPFLVRTSTSAALLGNAMADFALKSIGPKSAILLEDGTVYGRDFLDGVARGMKARPSVSITRFAQGSSDVAELVRKIRQASPEAVFFGFTQFEVQGRMVRALRSAGYQGALLGGPNNYLPAFVQSAAEGLPNFYYAALVGPLEGYPTAGAFLNAFQDRYKRAPEYASALGCDAVSTLAQALAAEVARKAGRLPTRMELARALRKVDFMATTGQIRFDAQGERSQGIVFIMQYGTDSRARMVGSSTWGRP
jgi:branched-chain amino acid transport system substrate-binding protein